MLIAPEWNELASSALCRSKEDNFLYQMAILEVKIEWEIVSEYYSHHYVEGQIFLFKPKVIVQEGIV